MLYFEFYMSKVLVSSDTTAGRDGAGASITGDESSSGGGGSAEAAAFSDSIIL